MELNIRHWGEITLYLNGYILDSIRIDENELIGINSVNEEFTLAKRTPAFWNPVDGKAYEAMDIILRTIKDELRSNNIFDLPQKDIYLEKRLLEIIKLYTKEY